jgi:predicted phosphodiesterase
LEFNDILEEVLGLKSKMNVYCVAGNHDYHLLNLTSAGSSFSKEYPLQFLPSLDLPKDNPKYLFRHGWEFDPAQHPSIMEILCYNLSNEEGKIRSDIWDVLTKSIKSDVVDKVKGILDGFEGKEKYLSSILSPPSERLKSNLGLVEHAACSSPREPGQILIFGHTHRPFVNTANDVVNAGSWVADAQITNTYVELDGNNVRLMQYGAGEITKREKCPA